jgi:signal transduction histidine kinase
MQRRMSKRSARNLAAADDRGSRSPVSAADAGVAPPTEVEHEEAGGSPTPPLPSRVLVVDDSDIALEIVREGLTRRGFIVAEASDGVQAIELARTWRPDVVVCDLHMPGMDGMQVVRRLAAIDVLIPVIMLSGEGDLSAVLRVVHQGVFDYVQKGSDTRALTAAVTRAAKHVRVLRENERLSDELRAANEELERRVHERTQALETANHELAENLARLQKTQEKLLHATRKVAFGMLVAGISHELNNPMSIILGYAQAQLRRLPEGDPSRSWLEIIERNAVRCGDVVKALQGFAPRTKSPRLKLEASALLERVRALAWPAASALGARVEVVSCETDLPLLSISEEEIESALLNLVHNGLEASQSGGAVRIRALSSCHGQDRRGVEIIVEDDGMGIEPENLGRVFQLFFTTKPPGKATGLGLSLARYIVEAHEGAITIESVVGKGTRVRAWLPACSAEASG